MALVSSKERYYIVTSKYYCFVINLFGDPEVSMEKDYTMSEHAPLCYLCFNKVGKDHHIYKYNTECIVYMCT